jgi:hypothetical protein
MNQILASAPPQFLTFSVVAGVKVVSLDDDGDELRVLDQSTAQVFAQTGPPAADAVTSVVPTETWLLTSVSSGVANITADPTALSAGNYSNSVTITCASGAVYVVPFAASVSPVDNIVATPSASHSM